MYYHFNDDGELIGAMQYEPIITFGRWIQSDLKLEVGLAKAVLEGDDWIIVPNYNETNISRTAVNDTYLQLINEACEVIRGLEKVIAEGNSPCKLHALSEWRKYRDELFRVEVTTLESIVWPLKPLLFGS